MSRGSAPVRGGAPTAAGSNSVDEFGHLWPFGGPPLSTGAGHLPAGPVVGDGYCATTGGPRLGYFDASARARPDSTATISGCSPRPSWGHFARVEQGDATVGTGLPIWICRGVGLSLPDRHGQSKISEPDAWAPRRSTRPKRSLSFRSTLIANSRSGLLDGGMRSGPGPAGPSQEPPGSRDRAPHRRYGRAREFCSLIGAN